MEILAGLSDKAAAMAQHVAPDAAPHAGAPIVRKNTVRLPRDIAHRIRAGHPWVYREALGPAAARPPSPAPRSISSIPTASSSGAGCTTPTARSRCACSSAIRTSTIDGELVATRVRAAVALRKRLLDLDRLGCVRLVNARGRRTAGHRRRALRRRTSWSSCSPARSTNLRDALYDALEAELRAEGDLRAAPLTVARRRGAAPGRAPSSCAAARRRSSSRSTRTT